MNIRRLRKVGLALTFVALSACGSDSTGPGSLNAKEALRSLALGLGSSSGVGLPFALTPSALGDAAHGIDGIDVVIDGTTEKMYALGLRVTYPAGTCMETIFVVPPSAGYLPVGCTPPPMGLVLALWQTRSGSRPPERMVFISADVGTSSFASFASGFDDLIAFPAFAMYISDREEFWMAFSGTLNSQVAATSLACNVPPPPFAKTSTCRVANFEESGQITFERFDFTAFEAGPAPARQTMELVIPRQTIRGILQSITEIAPLTFPDWDY